LVRIYPQRIGKRLKGNSYSINKRVINSGKIKEVISLTLNGVIDRDIYSNDDCNQKTLKDTRSLRKMI
jgi:hypothetical protein